MFLGRYLGIMLPNSCLYKQSRSIRPSIKIGKDKFQLRIDVKDFDRDELRIKARAEFVQIEGKQETKTKNGFVIKKFTKKYKLPSGCNPSTMKSSLSADGILTLTAPRIVCDLNTPCETLIPISFTEATDDNLDEVQHPGQKDKKS